MPTGSPRKGKSMKEKGLWPGQVRDALVDLEAELVSTLEGQLAGLYVFGSLVTGGFDPDVSDIDVLAVLNSDLSSSMFERLDNVHAHVLARHPEWTDRLEVIYFSRGALASFRGRAHPIAVISPGEPFHITTAEEDWNSNWYVVRNHGVALLGPDPRSFIGPIELAEIVTQQRKLAAGWAASVRPETKPGAKAYLVLTACRALYAAEKQALASKQTASEWASIQMPHWAGLLAQARIVRATRGASGQLEPSPVREFLKQAARRLVTTPQAI